MNSGALLTSIAILAAVWVQAGYQTRLRLKVARFRPLETSFAGCLMATVLLAIVEEGAQRGLVTTEWSGVARAGTTVITIGLIGWVLVAALRKQKFRTWNAVRYCEAVRDTIIPGREEELRKLAGELEATWETVVAAASHMERPEASEKTKEAGWRASLIMEAIAAPRMMSAVCREGGGVAIRTFKEVTAQSEDEGGDRSKEMTTTVFIEGKILRSLSYEATQKSCPLLDSNDRLEHTWRNKQDALLEMPYLSRHHPLVGRWETIIDKIWCDKNLIGRHNTEEWMSVGYEPNTGLEKLAGVLLATFAAVIQQEEKKEHEYQIAHIVCRMERECTERKGEEGCRKLAAFIERLKRAIDGQEVGTRQRRRKNTKAVVITQPQHYTRMVASSITICLAAMAHAQGIERDQNTEASLWIAANWHPEAKRPRAKANRFTYAMENVTKTEKWTARIARAIDSNIWAVIKGIDTEEEDPLITYEERLSLLGMYLRVEGMKPSTHPLIAKLHRRRRALHKCINSFCRFHLVPGLAKHGFGLEAICQYGITYSEPTQELVYTDDSDYGRAVFAVKAEKT